MASGSALAPAARTADALWDLVLAVQRVLLVYVLPSFAAVVF